MRNSYMLRTGVSTGRWVSGGKGERAEHATDNVMLRGFGELALRRAPKGHSYENSLSMPPNRHSGACRNPVTSTQEIPWPPASVGVTQPDTNLALGNACSLLCDRARIDDCRTCVCLHLTGIERIRVRQQYPTLKQDTSEHLQIPSKTARFLFHLTISPITISTTQLPRI